MGPGTEFERIQGILRGLSSSQAGVSVGPGDDAAVMMDGTVLSTDLAIEGIHFRLDWISPAEAGYRAAAVGVSDLAAMAAEPVGILVSVGVSGQGDQFESVMSGVTSLTEGLGIALLGGDSTRSPGPLIVDVTSVGQTQDPLLRSGAEVGDEIWVTGVLGAGAAATTLWEKGESVPKPLRDAFIAPQPRVGEARSLMDSGITAGIDLSDGIAGDAGHVAAASEVALIVDVDALPLHPTVGGLRLPSVSKPTDFALYGGDDFELLVTAPPGLLDAEVEAFVRQFDLPLTRVGRVTDGVGVWVQSEDSRTLTRLTRGGYDHFAAGAPL